MMSSLSALPSCEPADADYVLGKTGETVVYIFPTGDALMNRDAATAPAALVEYQRQKLLPAATTQQPAQLAAAQEDATAADEARLVDGLLASGKLTVAQIQVARYDQSVTGLSLKEALTLRGWL